MKSQDNIEQPVAFTLHDSTAPLTPREKMLVDSLRAVTMVAESMAHLRGLEREILPHTDAARKLLAQLPQETPRRVDRDNVRSVYSGINGKCCCGCAGQYYTADTLQGQRMISKVVGIIEGACEVDVDADGDNIATVVGNRIYVVHFNAPHGRPA